VQPQAPPQTPMQALDPVKHPLFHVKR